MSKLKIQMEIAEKRVNAFRWGLIIKYVIASDRRERRNLIEIERDCHVAIAPRNDRVFDFFIENQQSQMSNEAQSPKSKC